MNKQLTTIIVMICALSVLTAPATAQQRKARQQRSAQAPPAKPALTVVNNPVPTYLSGEVNVLVRGDENPIIRLQMVANGQTLVEFPAKDRIFKVNPADPDLVTIEDSPTKERDRYILLRSGKQFLPSGPGPGGSSAATSMLVQMTSGMVVTLLIYPVRELEQVVHRCVVRYDREAIVSARQAAGLAVNLEKLEAEEKAKPIITSLQFAQPFNAASVAQIQAAAQPSIKSDALPAPIAGTKTPKPECDATGFAPPVARATQIKLPENNGTSPDIWERVGDGKMKWSRAQHGLKAAAQTRTLDAKQRLVAVSVRNTLSVPLKIAPEQPELFIQTLDDKGRILQVEPIKLLKTETTHPNQLLTPGEIARYVIAYEPPILGAKQRLCVAVAQTNAADEPIMIELTTGTR